MVKAIALIVIMLNGQPAQVMIFKAMPEADCKAWLRDPAEMKAVQEIAVFQQGQGATAVMRCDYAWRNEVLKKSLQD